MERDEIRAAMELAAQAARAPASIPLQSFRSRQMQRRVKSDGSGVIDMDVSAERQIRSLLVQASP